jgi:phosphoribosylformimino-5-aminoimidazole carboxamide ribotide isomerase
VILLPAIDILDGKAVRLVRGDFAQQTTYDSDPLEAARRWVDDGARTLHIVDLDGARSGTPANLTHVERIARTLEVPVQLGGGLRTPAALEAAALSGAARLIVGTAALHDAEFLEAALERYGERLVVSLDARGGLLAAAGWTEDTALQVTSVREQLQRRGVSRFVFSSIERDGMLSGPDIDGARAFADGLQGSFVYSGGIGALADLQALAELRAPRLEGVIVGKAIYERRFGVGEAQQLLDAASGGG